MYVGVDEAGKGPVLGPMVCAAVRADPATLPDDVDDSKRVAPERRQAIAADLREREDVTVAVAFIEPAEIDRPETDMNTLTVHGQARAVSRVVEPDDRVLADAGDTSESRFARRLAEFVGEERAEVDERDDESDDLAVDAHHGADADDAVVGAASIVAKVARDARMAELDAVHDAFDGVGSGYPSDPTTREFLSAYVEAHSDVPACARRSWSTCDDVLAAAEQAGLDEF
ncbi:ribonuclease HII [Halorubrum gandharaense]